MALTPKITYKFTPHEVALFSAGRFGAYGQEDKRIAFLNRLHDPAETIYVGIGNEDQSRYGTIAIVVPKGYSNDRSTWPTPPKFDRSRMYYDYGDVTLHFDDRKPAKANISDQQLYELPDYIGPTVWNFVRKEGKPPVEVFDRMGHSITIGDFITFASAGYYKSDLELKFGFVESITPAGVIHVKTIKMDATDQSRSIRIPQADNKICKMSKEIIDELMIMRLTF